MSNFASKLKIKDYEQSDFFFQIYIINELKKGGFTIASHIHTTAPLATPQMNAWPQESYNWFRKLVPLPRPIKCNTKTNGGLASHVFSRFEWVP